ncbi:MAG: bifunctional folylpolyglutamate synthase/dihydrofolate synthase, partial [Deltaproteobacteria bacterium]
MTGGTGPSGPEIVRPGLSRISSAFSRSGHPEAGFRTLHIAGTNGKGSTACFAFSVLRLLPLGPLGLYTSPHLVSPEERILVDGNRISARGLREGFREAERLSREGDPLTYFEKMTWTACDWFRRKRVRFAVMETGLGGRWDATSACRPAVSVITTVDHDHAEWLGTDLPGIAREKAGILKKGVPLVAGRLRPAARRTVLRRAGELGCDAWELGRSFDWRERRDGAISLSLPGIELEALRVGMAGRFQRDNAAVAVAA